MPPALENYLQQWYLLCYKAAEGYSPILINIFSIYSTFGTSLIPIPKLHLQSYEKCIIENRHFGLSHLFWSNVNDTPYSHALKKHRHT